jgi:hypothetical protein
VEYIQEYAKDLVYGNDFTKLSDQLHILGEQHHRIVRLKSAVDYLIHDSPFILGLAYISEDNHLPINLFEQLVIELFTSYDNINILLIRNVDIKFQQTGRLTDANDSMAKDVEIKQILDKHNIQYHELIVNDNIIKDIMDIINK